jgi:hypothetical protein
MPSECFVNEAQTQGCAKVITIGRYDPHRLWQSVVVPHTGWHAMLHTEGSKASFRLWILARLVFRIVTGGIAMYVNNRGAAEVSKAFTHVVHRGARSFRSLQMVIDMETRACMLSVPCWSAALTPGTEEKRSEEEAWDEECTYLGFGV